MSGKTFVINAKVMAKGGVSIPENVREILGVGTGDTVSFVVEGNAVRLVNPAIHAMQRLQREMTGESERAGLVSEKEITSLVKQIRNSE